MEKKIVLCLLCLSLFIGVSAQQRYFEVKDESPQNGVFSGLDDEAGVIIVCNQSKTLSFDSSMDKTVNIYKFSKEFSNTHYVPFLEAYSKALGDNEYYEQVLKVIALLDKPEIKAILEILN
mgnify:CR=1 FL=1